jgi:tetratricopeptide (TPR) repeat protein
VSPSDFVSRGQALVAAGQFQEAVKVCRLGLLAKPNAVDGRVVLGQALLALKRYDEVLAEMRVALQLDSAAVPAQILKGEALLRKGDHHGAIEALHLALARAPGEPNVLRLLGQAEQASRQGPSSVSHPSAAFIADAGAETRHYPHRGDIADEGDEPTGEEPTREEATREEPTSLAAPVSRRRRSSQKRGAPAGTPQLGELAAGDKSGTVEVDPELEGVEVSDDLDFDALAAPPPAKARQVGSQRDSIRPSSERETKAEMKKFAARKGEAQWPDARTVDASKQPHGGKPHTPLIELDPDLELVEPRQPRLPPPTAVAQKGGTDPPPPFGGAAGRTLAPAVVPPAPPFGGAAGRALVPAGDPPAPPFVPAVDAPRPFAPSKPPGFVQAIAAQPHALQINPPLPAPPPTPAPAPVASAAVPRFAAAMPTMPAAPAPPPSPYAINEAPVWARATVAAVPDPRVGAAYAVTVPARPTPDPLPPGAAPFVESGAMPLRERNSSTQRGRPSTRRPRSGPGVVMWVVIGLLVIGGGVFAGLEIRNLRLGKQIAAALDRANELAKADTWAKSTAALGSLAKIADASGASENQAALARERALIAFEFCAGLDDAKRAVTELANRGALDGDIAAAYLALAQNDAKAAKLAADAALSRAPQDPAAHGVAGEAALLSGDLKAAVTQLREAATHDPRPLYGIALARALAASNTWDEALASLDRVLKTSPEHPGALIERARVLAASGRVATGTLAMDVRAQLDKVIVEGARPLAEQTRGVAPGQVAFAELALARVDQARNDVTAAQRDLRAAASVGLEDLRFAEEVVETLFAIGDPHVRAETDRALAMWPIDARVRLVLVQQQLVTGRAKDALDVLAKPSDLSALPLALALRGQAKLALNDPEGARADFDAGLKKAPDLELALIGRAQLEIAAGDLEEAKKLIEPHIAASGGMTATYAAVLRASGDPVQRAKAKELLVKAIAAAPNVDSMRVQLELARVERDLGDLSEARAAYDQAIRAGSFDGRLENALLSIDDGKVAAGRDALEALLKDSGDPVPPDLLLEVARARMLVGDHADAVRALEQATSLSNVKRWKLERERGRLALRRGDFAGAGVALEKALAGCGSDAETFLLGADLAFADDKRVASVVDRVTKLAPERLKATPEAQVVRGKLLLAAGKLQDAINEFKAAWTALDNAKASNLRLAQPRFGDAVAKGERAMDQKASARGALEELDLAITYDPTLYGAYLFEAALLDYDKQPKKALGLAKQGATLDPENADAWVIVGQLARKIGDRKTLAYAINNLGAIAPNSEALKQLQQTR